MNEHTHIGRIDPGTADRGTPAAFSAGEALVQPTLNRISIHGRVAQVEPKVMQVLLVMAARPGAVIARETFLDTVWAGTLADDYLLNRAVSELRKVFDDDAQSPRYIETIRKGGYRLIAPIAPARVAAAVAGPAATPDASPDAGAVAAPGTESDVAITGDADAADRRRGRHLAYGLAAMSGILVAGFAVLAALRAPSPAPGFLDGPLEVLPLTSFVGREAEPSLSPDGSRVAFIRDSGDGTFDVQVKTIGSEDVLALTHGQVDARHPLWSADGRAVLFARSGEGGTSILRVSALGGGATAVLNDPTAAGIRGMSLSPDGTQLAYAARADAASPYRIVLATLADGQRRVLTRPPPGSLGDIDPRFARDGRAIAFVRGLDEVTKDLYRVRSGDGHVIRLTFDNRKINGLAWTPDGARLLFTSTRSGMYGLWSLDPDDGQPQPVPLGNEDVHQPATTAGVDAVAFERWSHRSRLRRIDLATNAEADVSPHLRSTRWDSAPAWSPDGTRLAFTSNRSGPHGIWVSDHDGRNAVQVAGFGGAFIDNPAWSPDGTLITFDGSPDGRTAIFTVPAHGGPPTRLDTGPGDSRNPAWSRDGAWLYFESNRDGHWRIHAHPTAGGPSVAITPGRAAHPRESADGTQLLYSKPGQAGLWRLPRRDWSDGGTPVPGTLLVAGLDPRDGSSWASSAHGIHFVHRPDGDAPRLALFDPATASTTDLLTLPATFAGRRFDLSPDQTQLVFSETTAAESDLRLAVRQR